jgi:TM2 domain-containing membrane protein YozV
MYDVVACERCGAKLPAIATWCAACGAKRASAPSPRPVSPSPPAAASDAEFVECARCAEPIRARAKACRFCGHVVGAEPVAKPVGTDLKRVGDRIARVAVGEVKSPGLAACLSFLCPGLGQIYTGRVGRGITILVLPSFVLLLFVFAAAVPGRGLLTLLWLASLGFHVWQIADAYACASPAPAKAKPGRRPRRRR